MVPETNGRTLEEMDELFGEVGFAQADIETKARIEREIGLTALLGVDGPVFDRLNGKTGDAGSEELVEKK